MNQIELEALQTITLLDLSLQRQERLDMARYRKKESRRMRGKYFSRTASRTHYKNIKPRPQRGGIRL